ncbi:hypothetical protein OESDEN_04836 [Oesophagostomum dentatum]|uniref:Uncharacterized protein n=1 Tax=Oesophagostomum dentatum TaxID=61180 RepID=A0A0B1TD96_OESDE|nr:hypothetical protein OESDEN_04836 [Oesophagostomum dentatum]
MWLYQRQFKENRVNPPRTEQDFYRGYDPMVGIGTAITLVLFFFVVTVKSCVRYLVRKWRMYQFYKVTKEQSGGETHADDERPIVATA